MKTFKLFKTYIQEEINAPVKAEDPEVLEPSKDVDEAHGEDGKAADAGEDPESKSEDIGNFIKTNNGYKLNFTHNGKDYILSLSPLDSAKEHFKFTYYVNGMKDSSDIDKFGSSHDWLAIWSIVEDALKTFIRRHKPETLKFVGMSASKRPSYFKELFKLLSAEFKNYFRDLGYHSSFDHQDLAASPSLVIRKGDMKEPKKDMKESYGYFKVETLKDRKIKCSEFPTAKWKCRFHVEVIFLNPDSGLSVGVTEANDFDNYEEAFKWAKEVKSASAQAILDILRGEADKKNKEFPKNLEKTLNDIRKVTVKK